MELLLFLSALLSGLTGVISGERRAEMPQVQSSAAEAAVVAIAEQAVDAVLPARLASTVVADLPSLIEVARSTAPARTVPVPRDIFQVCERRLE